MSKERKKVDNRKAVTIIAITIAICINIVLWAMAFNNVKLQTVSYAVESKPVANMIIEQLNLNNIIEKNTSDIITEEIIVEEKDIEYKSIYNNNAELPKGTLQVVQEGRDGKQNIITKRTYCNGELVKEDTDTKIIISSTDKIIEIGTANYKSNYKIKVGDELYVTADTVSVRMEPDKNSNKLVTLEKQTKVKLLEMKENWYYISYNMYKGWIQADCLTYLDPNATKYDEKNGTYTKAQLIAKLSKDMKLNTPSGLSLEQFKKVLSGNKSDKNKIIENNAQYFYYAEKQYNVNGVFLAAVAIHESNWGTSKIAKDKRNLFGYGASDGDPYNNAKTFSTYSEGIDLLARVFVKYYLNPAGTTIYRRRNCKWTIL